MITISNRRPLVLPIILVLTLAICLGGHYLIRYFTYPDLSLPRSFGLLKDVFDPVIVILAYWGGWVFGVPWLVSYYLKASINWQIFLYIFSSALMGLIQTMVGFDSYSAMRISRGIVTYLAIFGITFLILLCLTSISRGIKKWRHHQ